MTCFFRLTDVGALMPLVVCSQVHDHVGVFGCHHQGCGTRRAGGSMKQIAGSSIRNGAIGTVTSIP